MKTCLHLSLIVNKKLLNYFLVFLFILSGCGKNDNSSSTQDDTRLQNTTGAATGEYMDEQSWELARQEIKTIEKVIASFNDFYDVWGWAYEHRVFFRYREALETADYLPGKIDEAEKIAGNIRSVKGYAEIDNIKKCYLEMVPLLRSGAKNLKDSIIAARDNNSAEEKNQVQAYTEKWKAAMIFSKKSFAYFQELLTRGSRAEYRKLVGEPDNTKYDPGAFKKIIRTYAAEYDSSILKKIDVIKKLAAASQWGLALVKTEEVYLLLQSSIMIVGQADPGNEKKFWDTKQELITTMSHQMMAMKKFGEYLEASRSGDFQEAGKAKKIYDILIKSALDSRTKLKKLGY